MKSIAFQTISNNTGFRIDFLENGMVQKIENQQIRLSLKPENIFGDGGFQLFLRRQDTSIRYQPLTGSVSQSVFGVDKSQYFARGTWEDIEYEISIEIADEDNAIKVATNLLNVSGKDMLLDLIIRQDVGLKTVNNGLVNEYYVSQYLERRLFDDQLYGKVICCRQNMNEKTGHPWMMLFCEEGSIAGSTDGRQFYGPLYREERRYESLNNKMLGGDYAGESPVVALQSNEIKLKSGEQKSVSFYIYMMNDHPDASSPNDLATIPKLLQYFAVKDKNPRPAPVLIGANNLFNNPLLTCKELTNNDIDILFPGDQRHVEFFDGKYISFFYGEDKHVVLKAKELIVDRPHGHIIQAKAGLQADENVLSTTCYASGIFNSHLVQGNTNFNVLLSINTTQFNQNPEQGQRIFVEIEGQFRLLAVPSAFEMGTNFCRWIYKTNHELIQVRTWTSKEAAIVYTDVKVLKGNKLRIKTTLDFDPLNNWSIVQSDQKNVFIALPADVSMTKEKFPDARYCIIVPENQYIESSDQLIHSNSDFNKEKLFCLTSETTDCFEILFSGELKEISTTKIPVVFDIQFNHDVSLADTQIRSLVNNLKIKSENNDIAAISEIIPWFGQNALTHFLTPHGLEQFGGAAWGTRDVSQGPFDLLLSMGKFAEARKLLLTIFSNQHPEGGWPQWWMFDSYASIRAHEAHGDIFYWVIIAMAQYVRVTGDLSVFTETIPYFAEQKEDQLFTSLKEHLDRLIHMIVDSFIPETCLVPFGGGDWNDSLQPVSQDLAKRMISSWTVQMNYQAFTEIAEVYQKLHDEVSSKNLESIANKIKSDFNKYLIKDGVVAGYGLVEENGKISVLLHPSDNTTGIKYSLLPMDRGVISGIFSKEQADFHQLLIENQLKGPDGARLMDRPLKYRGGIQTIFQRAESSTFFGREIGIMYVHEHIRYAESQAVTGKAEAFVKALRQANPVDYHGTVPMGDLRQANCYYSSSDVAFSNRYDADEYYQDVIDGKLTLRGGWRVYSSGPGIYIGLVVQRLLGIRKVYKKLVIDPVMPFDFNGLEAELNILGHQICFKYYIENQNHTPSKISLNGSLLTFELEGQPYRSGGAIIDESEIRSLLHEGLNLCEIWV